MLVKDIKELCAINALIKIVDLSTGHILALSCTKKGIKEYTDKEIKTIDTSIVSNGDIDFPVIDLYI